MGMKSQETTPDSGRQARFLSISGQYKEVVAKVCSMYCSGSAPFADLYQEVMVNLWTGLETYRGESKMSTWIYRLAINTCITWHRRNRRYVDGAVPLESCPEPCCEPSDNAERQAELTRLIGLLEPFEKALLTLWLDEKSYDEISSILGISRANVATRLHRVRAKLTNLANQ